MSLRLSVWSGLEQAEVDTAVGAMLHEAGMGAEVQVLAVLQDKQAAGCQRLMFEDQLGKRVYALEGVWRVGEDEVKLVAA